MHKSRFLPSAKPLSVPRSALRRPITLGSLERSITFECNDEKNNDVNHFRNGRSCFDFLGHSRDFRGRTDRAAGRRHGRRPQQSDAGVVGSSVLARPLGPPASPTGMAAISLLSRPGRPLRAPRLNQLWPMSVDQKPILVRDWQATRAQWPVVPRFSICHYPHPPLPGSSGRHRTGMGG